MRVVGLLSWYEEPASWLAATVAALARLCDHVIAVDGPYAQFPGALRKPASGSEQADVIAHTAAGAGIGCTVHTPRSPWWGGEVEKRDWMFRAAELVTTESDWLLVVDADEVLTDVPPDTKRLLAASANDVAEVRIWDRDGSEVLDRRLLRAQRGIRVEGAHYVWTSPQGVLRGNTTQDLAPAEPLWDVRMEHRYRHRNEDRQAAKRSYYARLPDIEQVRT